MSTLGRERIELQSLFSVDAVMRNITGVNVGFCDTQRPLYFARGFQITDFQVDGILTYSGGTKQEYDTALYERVEVVRGANGLLSGAGLPSATVNLVRKRPGRELALSAGAAAGRWDFRRVQADLSLPLAQAGGVRARLVAVWQDSASHLDRYREDKPVWLASVEADLGEATVVTAGFQNQDNNPVGSIWGTIPRFASDGSLANLPRSTRFAPAWARWRRESGTAFLNLEHQFSAHWSAKLALARTGGDVDSLRAYASGFPNPSTGAGVFLLAGVGRSEDVHDNVDAYLSGSFPLLGQQHDLVPGYNQSVIDSNTIVLGSVAAWRYGIPDLRAWRGDAPQPVYGPTGANRVAVTDQRGLYGSVRWRVGPALSLITGARWSRWKTYTENFNASGAFTGPSAAYEVPTETTPSVGALFELARDWSVYAGHTGIFRPQNLRDRNDVPLAPVGGSNGEAGIKGSLLDNRLSLSLALYRTQQDNLGVRDSGQPDGSLPGGASAYIGVDGTRSSGVEIEASGSPLAGWPLPAGYTFVDAERQATDLIYATLPRHHLQLSTSLQLPGAWSAFTLGASAIVQSGVVGLNIRSPSGPQTVTQERYG